MGKSIRDRRPKGDQVPPPLPQPNQEIIEALRWRALAPRDVGPPPDGGYREGWDYTVGTRRVWAGWTSRVAHGVGPAPKDGDARGSASYGARWMFSSEIAALTALRHEIAMSAATDLLDIDRRIAALAAETNSVTPGSQS